jgi:hypothetical protein
MKYVYLKQIDDFIDDARRNAAVYAGVASQSGGSNRGGRR